MKPTLITSFLLLCTLVFYTQDASQKNTSYTTAAYMKTIPALSTMKNIPPADEDHAAPIRRSGVNIAIPGKGFPKGGGDPLVSFQQSRNTIQGKAPLISFDAHSGSALNDPTGAIGPNHYVNAFNSGFGIRDRSGNVLLPEASLSAIFPGETLGDPIVVYDRYADRFIIMEFSDNPNGYLIAVCQGPDPVNDGWFTYRFNTGTFPDYVKLSIWSDGYYVTANKDNGSNSDVVWALERDKMLLGDVNAQMVGFPLTGVTTSGFYSPAGFNLNGPELPPLGNAPIVYLQDDAWAGVSTDHLKLWNINVDWNTPNNSTISAPQIINVSPFDGVFNNGSFSNLPQPAGPDIDALQATIMYMAQYRRFTDHNSAVFNYVVDLNGNDNLAGIRWFELRQTNDGDPWNIYQEGTYVQPYGLSAFCGSMAMDKYGNIGLAYTVVSNSQAPCIRFTGRLATDPLHVMTQAEDVIVNSNSSDPTLRYGDYAQMTVDPLDDQTFWHIAEYFNNGSRRSRVGAFQLSPGYQLDAGVVSIDSPVNGSLGIAETITVTIQNFGLSAISNVPVSVQVNGGTIVNGLYAGTIDPMATVTYTFDSNFDFSTLGSNYLVESYTSLVGDEFTDNNGVSTTITNIASIDLGVTAIANPSSASNMTNAETIIVTIQNFGGLSQSNFPVSYTINGGTVITEQVAATINPGQSLDYSFTTQGNFAMFGDYLIHAYTSIDGDANSNNNDAIALVNNSECQAAVFNLLTDCYAYETSWRLEKADGSLVQEVVSGSLNDVNNYNYDFCLGTGCYKLIVEDSFGDGLAGSQFACNADGNYSFELNGLSIFTSTNPDFGYTIEHDFCVESTSTQVVVNLKAMLQGAFNSSSQLMNDLLRENNQLPLTEPYTALGFQQVGGGGNESTTASVFQVTGDNAIVDWILVELREGTNSTNTIATQVGLIQKDGDIVGMDGISPLEFSNPGIQSVYVVIRHRNHFGVRTGNTYATSGLINVDFTDISLPVFGTNAMVNMNGLNMLIGGDANSDGQVNTSDLNGYWRLENGQPYDYSNTKADFNMDGVVGAVDKNLIWRVNNTKVQSLD